MATKKNNYITAELDWAEKHLESWKAYIDKNPFDKMDDRKAWKDLKSGGQMPVVIASIEQQQTSVRNTMKDYLSLLEVVNGLREREEAKIESRGKKELSAMADDWAKEKSK